MSPNCAAHFGVVLQDPFLFTGTIAENIRLGSEWITDERMKAAADEVNVGDFIRALPGKGSMSLCASAGTVFPRGRNS